MDQIYVERYPESEAKSFFKKWRAFILSNLKSDEIRQLMLSFRDTKWYHIGWQTGWPEITPWSLPISPSDRGDSWLAWCDGSVSVLRFILYLPHPLNVKCQILHAVCCRGSIYPGSPLLSISLPSVSLPWTRDHSNSVLETNILPFEGMFELYLDALFYTLSYFLGICLKTTWSGQYCQILDRCWRHASRHALRHTPIPLICFSDLFYLYCFLKTYGLSIVPLHMNAHYIYFVLGQWLCTTIDG